MQQPDAHTSPETAPTAAVLTPTQSPGNATDPENWLAEHGDALYRVALARTRDPATAEDLVQECLLAALRGLAASKHPDNMRAWLMSILRFKIIDHFRHRARETPSTELRANEQDDTGDFVATGAGSGNWIKPLGPKPWPAPGVSLENAEFWRAFDRCLSLLPGRTGQVFLLRELDGMDSATLCKDLNLTATNLWVLLHRARQSLRRCLEKNWFSSS